MMKDLEGPEPLASRVRKMFAGEVDGATILEQIKAGEHELTEDTAGRIERALTDAEALMTSVSKEIETEIQSLLKGLTSPRQAREILGGSFQGRREIERVFAVDGIRVTSWSGDAILNATPEQLQAWKQWAIENTEGGSCPLVTAIDQVMEVEWNGELHKVNFDFIQRWLAETSHPRLGQGRMAFPFYTPVQQKEVTGSGNWSYLFSGGVKGSNNMDQDAQQEYVRQKLGGDLADMTLSKAGIFHRARTGEVVAKGVYMRESVRDAEGIALCAFGGGAGGRPQREMSGAGPDENVYASFQASSPEIPQ